MSDETDALDFLEAETARAAEIRRKYGPNEFAFKLDGLCPLCGHSWGAESGVCDHDADWYRDWLKEATELLQERTNPS